MPQLRITITAPLPDEPLAAFRERHEVEAAVLEMLETLHGEDRDISVTCEIESGGLKAKDKPASGEKRTRGPNKAKNDASPQSAGGIARADALSPERRSEIAKQAAETRWNGAGAEAAQGAGEGT